jgi:hypothetical protein
MLTFLLVLLALIALAVFPVMYTARALGAEKTGIGSVLLVLVLQLCLSKLVEAVISSGVAGALAGFFGGALIIQMVMVTTYKRAPAHQPGELGDRDHRRAAAHQAGGRPCDPGGRGVHVAAGLAGVYRLTSCESAASFVRRGDDRLPPGCVVN